MKVDLERISPAPDFGDIMLELTKVFSDKMPDYHVFVIPNEVRDEHIDLLEFQVFYEKDQFPIDYEGLREILLNLKKADS